MLKLTLKEIVEKETPKAGEGLSRILKNRTSAKSLIWLKTQFENIEIIYPQDLADYLHHSYQNSWYTLRNFEGCGLLYRKKESKGAFYPTKNPDGSFVLNKYLRHALKTLGYKEKDYEM